MTTLWTCPTIINQYAESGAESAHIQWNNEEFDAVLSPGDQSLTTKGELLHIARSPRVDFTNKTYFLSAAGYNFENIPDTVSGIALRLKAQRHGRITDETVQIMVDGSPIGDNRATLSVDPVKVYGGPSDLWGIPNVSVTDLESANFGILLRFKSHPNYPHRTGATIFSLELQIY